MTSDNAGIMGFLYLTYHGERVPFRSSALRNADENDGEGAELYSSAHENLLKIVVTK